MKKKITIVLITLLLTILGMVQLAAALSVDKENPSKEAQKAFSEDSFVDKNKNLEKGLCGGFNDKVNPKCPDTSGGNPKSTGADKWTGGQEESSKESSSEASSSGESPGNSSGSNSGNSNSSNSSSKSKKSKGEVLGVSTERDPLEEKIKQISEEVEQLNQDVQALDAKVGTQLHEAASESAQQNYFWPILLIAILFISYFFRTELQFQKIRERLKKRK